MKKITALALTCLALATAASAAEGAWTTNYKEATEQAAKEKKLVLLDFTGSDWCPPCKALHKNVLGQEEFLDYAKENLILVELDFPRRKAQSDELKKQNRDLSAKYKIEGYPTIIILSADGKELIREVGYRGDSAKTFIAKIERVK